MYGENFMKLCRELFPTLLEQEGLLTEILTSSFSANSGTLYEDIMQNGLEDEFKNNIYNKVDVEKNKLEIIEEKNSTNIENFQLPGYIFNMERNGIYYCPGNIIIEKWRTKTIRKPRSTNIN